MALAYTEEKLNGLDKKTIIQLFLSQQEQFKQIDHNLQLMLEQMSDLKRHRFGRSSERHETENHQISFMEVNGKIVFLTSRRKGLMVARRTHPDGTKEETGETGRRPRRTSGCCGAFYGCKGV